jgi:DNA polymerase III subunit delta'
MFDDFYGNEFVARTLSAMLSRQRIPQTILLGGPDGVGKATLVRRFAAALLGGGAKIEQDDLSLPANQASIADRQKWTSEQRNEDPLFFGSHPDFLTFPPDGPLQQISIEQMRLLKERAQYQPLSGNRRVFLIDRIDRANESAANSLLKTLEEPPPYLILILTALNTFDLLPTIRSRSVVFHCSPLSNAQMKLFAESRGLNYAERRIALSGGSPGLAASMDLDEYDQRRRAMFTLLKVAAGRAPFPEWAKFSEALSARKQDKLDGLLDMLFQLLEDVLLLSQGRAEIRNADLLEELEPIASHVSLAWLRAAVVRCDELCMLVRRNIQKSIALDAFAISLRRLALQKE